VSDIKRVPNPANTILRTLNDVQKSMLLFLSHLTPPVSIDTLISLSGARPIEVLNIMESLKKKKIIFEKEALEKGFYFLSDLDFAGWLRTDIPGKERQDTMRRVIDFYLDSPDMGQEATLALSNLYFKLGDDAQGLPFIKKAADMLYKSGQIEKAVIYYDYIIQYFADTIPDRQEAVDYLDSIYRKVSNDSFSSSHPETILSLLNRAYDIAKRHHHLPYQAKMKMSLGLILQVVGRHREASRHINQYWTLAEKINDEELTRTGVLQMCRFLVIKGSLAEATDYYEKMTGGLEQFGNTVEDLISSLVVACTHVTCGRISRGLGMIDAIHAKAQTFNFPEAVGLAELAMAIALIEMRKISEAEAYLDKLKSSVSKDVLNHMMMGIYHDCRAFILCSREDYDSAFQHLKLSHVPSGTEDSRHHFFTFWPWSLEYLLTLESKGYSFEERNLDAEIEKIMAWNNLYTKGAALRYRALRAMERKLSEEAVLKDLKLSEKYLKKVGAETELARTRIALGNYFSNKGQRTRGRAYLEKARISLSEIDPTLFPKDLLDIIPWKQKINMILDKITAINKSLGTARDVPSYLERTINAAMDFTMATRGMFLTVEDGKLKMIAGRNIIPTLFDKDAQKPVNEIIIDAIEEDKEIVMPKGNSHDEAFRGLGITSFVGMPVALGNRRYGYLALDNQYNKTIFSEHSIPFARMIASQIALGLFSIATYEEVRELKDRFEDEAIFYRREKGADKRLEMIIGQSERILDLIDQIKQVAPTDSSVLVLGETGVGKELVAKAIHNLSDRKDGPFIPVNIATLPQDLVASELFGHEKGAFTGANEKKRGRFELADGGTIFLDEIGDLPASVQVKLLRVLQEGTFERLGSAKPIRSNFRVLAATHKDLRTEAQAGTFRQDLYYRLNVFPIHVPPLRQRKDDIGLLARHFLDINAKKLGKPIGKIPDSELEKLKSYDWPGNVRELEHVVERAVILSHGRRIRFSGLEPPSDQPFGDDNHTIIPLADLEKAHIERALVATRWRVSGPRGAAKLLGLTRATLRFRMQKFGLSGSRSAKGK
jgi:transcriptional regulator with GAF, ATPase, and Fis domain